MFIRCVLLLALLLVSCGTPGAVAPTSLPPAETVAPAATAVVIATSPPRATAPATTPKASAPSLDPNTVAVLVRGGGIAGDTITTTITLDQLSTSSRPGEAKTVTPEAIATLQSALEATGIYDIESGEYMPLSRCCDRYTYRLTLERNGETLVYTTMDDTPDAPPSITEAIALVDDFAANAYQATP